MVRTNFSEDGWSDIVVANDGTLFSKLLGGSSALAAASFSQGATRQGPSPSPCFIKEIGHYIYSGDTALHFAAAVSSAHGVDFRTVRIDGIRCGVYGIPRQ